MKVKKYTDPKNKGRVYKDSADKSRQAQMEGKNTPFQRALRASESSGKSTFLYGGKSYASRPRPQTAPKKAPMAVRATGGYDMGAGKPGTGHPVRRNTSVPEIAKNKRNKRNNFGTHRKKNPIYGGGARGPSN